MLQLLGEQVAECLRRAAAAKAQADAIADPILKKSYKVLESGWLFLARSYTITERLEKYLEHETPDK